MRLRVPGLAAAILLLALVFGAVSLGFAASDAHPAASTSILLAAEADAASSRPVRERLLDDLHYSGNNVLEDAEDVIKSPLRIPETVEPGGLLRRRSTPVFAGAAGVSEYFDNAWYASIPAYTAATAVGFGRIGHDAHWLSDIAASAVFGVGTTELLLYMHKRHEDAPAGRWKIFPTG